MSRRKSAAAPARAFAARPLKPRKLLLAALSIVLVIWITTLLVLYLTTVYSQRP